MRSIDADDFISQMKDLYHRAGWNEREVHFSLQDLICNIDNMKTVEPKPKEGEWWGDGDGYADGQIVLDMWTCSECGAIYEADEPPYRCCPNCGTRMLNYDEH